MQFSDPVGVNYQNCCKTNPPTGVTRKNLTFIVVVLKR